MTCGFLWGNTGYYRYDEGYRPSFADEDCFAGRIVHPQHWPEDLDWAGPRIVVIGSEATAVTLVPALAAAGSPSSSDRRPTSCRRLAIRFAKVEDGLVFSNPAAIPTPSA